MKSKYCSGCKIIKKVKWFSKNANDKSGYSHYCKICAYKYQKAHRNRYPKRAKLAYRKAILSKYGLTIEDYNRMLLKQNKVCKICLKNNKVKGQHYLQVDHCHKTNKVRGLLCRSCNTGLGVFNDRTDLLNVAKKYLIQFNKTLTNNRTN